MTIGGGDMFKRAVSTFYVILPFFFISEFAFASGGISTINADVENGAVSSSYLTSINQDGSFTVTNQRTNFKVNITSTGEVTVFKENGSVERVNADAEPIDIEKPVAGTAAVSPPISTFVSSPPISTVTAAGSNPISTRDGKVSSDPISTYNADVGSSFMKKFIGTGK